MTNVNQGSTADVTPRQEREPDVTGPTDGEVIVSNESGVLPDTWMTAEEICRFFRVGRRTFYRWRHTRTFPKPDLQLGKVHRWRHQTVEAWAATVMDQGQHLAGKES